MKGNGLLALRVLLGLATLGGGIAGAVDPATVSFNSPVFQDHMVLQQGRAVPIWGTGSPVGGQLTVTFNGQTKVATIAADRSWRVELDAMTAGGPHVLQVTGHNTLVVEDVLIGEVWLASGQSNMVKQPVQPVDRGGYPLVRFLRNRNWQDNPAETAWHVGRLLYDARHVPIGIINLGASDTPIREWLGAGALQYLPPEIVAEIGVRTGRFYRQMIAPITPYAIRGVFWWQGESDYHPTTAFTYGPQLVALIKSWRQVFEQADLPFIFVQLPSGRGPSPRRPSYDLPGVPPDPRYGVDMYDAYLDTLRSVPFTGMVVTKDLGHGPHPYNRVPFAERMVLWARHLAYGDDITYCGPIVESATAEGARVRIRFREGTAKALHGIRPHPPQGFALSEDGQLFDWAKVEIDGSDVVLSNDHMAHPTLVRYGWHEYPRWANLVNDRDMAASPFEIEVGP
jgi:sialate O-acetylesterase